MKNLKIVDIINSEFAVSPEDGELIFNLLEESIKKGTNVSLDFCGVDLTTTAFLNTAIGSLYRDFDKDTLNKFITMKNISNSDLILVKKVIERAKITFTEDNFKEIEVDFGDE